VFVGEKGFTGRFFSVPAPQRDRNADEGNVDSDTRRTAVSVGKKVYGVVYCLGFCWSLFCFPFFPKV